MNLLITLFLVCGLVLSTAATPLEDEFVRDPLVPLTKQARAAVAPVLRATADGWRDEPPAIEDATTREFVLLVEPDDPFEQTNALSRAIVLLVEPDDPYEQTDASSREIVLLIEADYPYEQTDAVSREFIVFDTHADLNCDGSVNFKDINPFVMYLSSFSVWQTAYPDCLPQVGDINQDGSYPSFKDINPFVALLSGGG